MMIYEPTDEEKKLMRAALRDLKQRTSTAVDVLDREVHALRTDNLARARYVVEELERLANIREWHVVCEGGVIIAVYNSTPDGWAAALTTAQSIRDEQPNSRAHVRRLRTHESVSCGCRPPRGSEVTRWVTWTVKEKP